MIDHLWSGRGESRQLQPELLVPRSQRSIILRVKRRRDLLGHMLSLVNSTMLEMSTSQFQQWTLSMSQYNIESNQHSIRFSIKTPSLLQFIHVTANHTHSQHSHPSHTFPIGNRLHQVQSLVILKEDHLPHNSPLLNTHRGIRNGQGPE